MKSKLLYNFWHPFSIEKTVWDLVWKFDRPANFLSGKCAKFCVNSDNTGKIFPKQKNSFRKNSTDFKKQNFEKHRIIFRSNFKNDTKKNFWQKHHCLQSFFGDLEWSFDPLLKKFCQKIKHFLTAVKKQNGSINFCQNLYVYFEHCHGQKIKQFRENC